MDDAQSERFAAWQALGEAVARVGRLEVERIFPGPLRPEALERAPAPSPAKLVEEAQLYAATAQVTGKKMAVERLMADLRAGAITTSDFLGRVRPLLSEQAGEPAP